MGMTQETIREQCKMLEIRPRDYIRGFVAGRIGIHPRATRAFLQNQARYWVWAMTKQVRFPTSDFLEHRAGYLRRIGHFERWHYLRAKTRAAAAEARYYLRAAREQRVDPLPV